MTAVFGVPAAHEDDALRACRAAVDIRASFRELGVQGWIGVNTREVVTGTEERLAAGHAVNVAARCQNAGDPGEILIGHARQALAAIAAYSEALALYRQKENLVAAGRVEHALEEVRAGAHA